MIIQILWSLKLIKVCSEENIFIFIYNIACYVCYTFPIRKSKNMKGISSHVYICVFGLLTPNTLILNIQNVSTYYKLLSFGKYSYTLIPKKCIQNLLKQQFI